MEGGVLGMPENTKRTQVSPAPTERSQCVVGVHRLEYIYVVALIPIPNLLAILLKVMSLMVVTLLLLSLII